MMANDGQHLGYSGRGMMHTTEARVKGLWKDHIVKLEAVVYSGAMEISANQGHIQHKLGSGGAFSKGIMYSN